MAVHPSRPLDGAIETLGGWASRNDVELVQIVASERQVFPLAEAAASDLVVALGGDGTALTALRAAEPVRAPVLAVACGSVGALSAVTAGELSDALDRVRAGDWARCTVPALAVSTPEGERAIASTTSCSSAAAPDSWSPRSRSTASRTSGSPGTA